MKRLVCSVAFCALVVSGCGGPALQTAVKYSRLSVNTVMLGTQAADEANGEAFAAKSDALAQDAYEENVVSVAESMGLDGEEDVCAVEGLLLPDAAKLELQQACDAGFAQWCDKIRPVWEQHCLRTCIIHTLKDGLRAVEEIVDGLQYIQAQYSADSTFKALKEEDKLKWTDYAMEVKEWFGRALVLLGSLVHLLHESGVEIPDALNVITDIAGGFAPLPHNYERPVCDCPAYPENSGCQED